MGAATEKFVMAFVVNERKIKITRVNFATYQAYIDGEVFGKPASRKAVMETATLFARGEMLCPWLLVSSHGGDGTLDADGKCACGFSVKIGDWS